MAAADDREAEDIVNRLQVRGCALASLVGAGLRQPPGDGAADQATGRHIKRPGCGSSSARSPAPRAQLRFTDIDGHRDELVAARLRERLRMASQLGFVRDEQRGCEWYRRPCVIPRPAMQTGR